LRFHPAMEKLLVTGLGVKALGAMRRAGLRSRALELLHSYVSAVHAAREQSDGQAHLKHSAASL